MSQRPSNRQAGKRANKNYHQVQGSSCNPAEELTSDQAGKSYNPWLTHSKESQQTRRAREGKCYAKSGKKPS